LLQSRGNIDRLRKDRRPWGAILESFIFAELVKQASWADFDISFYHYRDKDQVEVDIVMENEDGNLVGIEVKGAATVTTTDFNGLTRLAQAATENFQIGIVLYDGEQILPFGKNMYAVPISSLWK